LTDLKRNKKKKNRSKLIGNIAFYLVLVVVSAYIFVSVVLPEKKMEIFHFDIYIIVSPSMEPVLNTDDLIIIVQADESDLEKGDIITFKTYIPELGAENYVTHYIGDIQVIDNQTIYKTHGENTAPGDYDEWINSDSSVHEVIYTDIVGEYSFKIPYVGVAFTLLSDPIFMIMTLISIVSLVVLIKYLVYIKKHKEKETQ